MMWDESKAGRQGNKTAAVILKWTDNICYGQNKNMSAIICFPWILKKYPQIRCINPKFPSQRTHTHMEAETIHALIKREHKKKIEQYEYPKTMELAAIGLSVFQGTLCAQHGS
ncbi:hypothetical protein PR048_013373 [Dryococelus australis]|uniref:Uncharacterized protein n=1 Tax=Dryococelus australis TaxID=614101 RepID=A0ABQ9HS07_9NEOP|nr:hypothetical protein PR048_013373 [Dryococelus australis]